MTAPKRPRTRGRLVSRTGRPWQRKLAVALLLVVVVAASALIVKVWWTSPGPSRVAVVVDIPRGSAPASIARQLAAAGVLTHPRWFGLITRLQGASPLLQAGEYAFPAAASPRTVLEWLVNGRVTRYSVTFIEGHTTAEAWARLRAHPMIKVTPGLTVHGLMQELGDAATPAEGAFFPDTYDFHRGTRDVEVMRQARERLARELAAVWGQRAPGLPLRDSQEALILASLVEKETGAAAERPLIARVFINRLSSHMRLQTDPSVIYGLGSRYDGNLRKADLRRDGPYNTYRRAGLPPTPIAMPGRASLHAATHPADTTALYFVATGNGDGRHVFSTTLQAHNAAVRALVARSRAAATAPQQRH